MTQTIALLLDSYRELKSRSLFWITLAISALVAISLFGTINFTDTGWRVLWFSTNESEFLRAGTESSRDLMAWLFSGVFVFWWLSWGAILLAVLSTASILPGSLQSGSIDITLAKPISRTRLFVMKVIGALLFVLLQTTLSVVLAFVLLGIQVGMWLPAILWSIPLIVIQFFYLYSVSALVAVITRSTLASLLVTILFWAMVSLVQFSSNQLDKTVVSAERIIAATDEKIDAIEQRAADVGRELTPPERGRIDRLEAEKKPMQQQIDVVAPYHRPIRLAELTVPKTGDIQKIIAGLCEAPTFSQLFFSMQGRTIRPAGFDDDEWQMMQEAGIEGDKAVRDVKIAQSLGSSLLVSLITMALAALIFWWKDF